MHDCRAVPRKYGIDFRNLGSSIRVRWYRINAASILTCAVENLTMNHMHQIAPVHAPMFDSRVAESIARETAVPIEEALPRRAKRPP
jgi:hypothetical protein